MDVTSERVFSAITLQIGDWISGQAAAAARRFLSHGPRPIDAGKEKLRQAHRLC